MATKNSALENLGKGIYNQIKNGDIVLNKVAKLVNRDGVAGKGQSFSPAKPKKGAAVVIVGSFKADDKKNPRYFIELKLEKDGVVRRSVVSGAYARKSYNRLANPPQGRKPSVSSEDIAAFSEALGL